MEEPLRLDPDDEIQPKRGRPFRKVENGFERLPERGNGRRCGECPKRGRLGACSILARHVGRNEMCCRYGYVLIGAARQEARRKAPVDGPSTYGLSGMPPEMKQQENNHEME